jgi:hypothetical protein
VRAFRLRRAGRRDLAEQLVTVMQRHLRAALALATRGMHVFPCGVRAKTPVTARGCLDATIDRQTIERWWHDNPDYNIGLRTGQVSNVFVIDVDGVDAEAALRKLEAEHGAVPATVETITGRGRHIWLKYPAGTTVCNSVGKIAPGVDTRGDNAYVLTPPSVHPSGRRYAWSVDSANKIAAAPDWLLARITSASANEGACVSEWRQLATDGVAEGKRNDSVARLTGHLLRRYVDPRVTLELIRTWNAIRCRPPLTGKEIEQIVDSIAGKELKRRKEIGHGR